MYEKCVIWKFESSHVHRQIVQPYKQNKYSNVTKLDLSFIFVHINVTIEGFFLFETEHSLI